MHGVHVLLCVCVSRSKGGGSTMYQTWWADVWLLCFCDAAAQAAGGTSGKQQTPCVCVCMVISDGSLCFWSVINQPMPVLCLCCSWLLHTACLNLNFLELAGFIIAVHSILFARAVLVQGFSWLLPWKTKLCGHNLCMKTLFLKCPMPWFGLSFCKSMYS